MALKKTGLACGIALASFSAMAYDLPGGNMGDSSFYDGAPAPNGPGWYFLEYLQSIRADTLKGNNGKDLPVANPKTDMFVPLSQIIYVSHKKWGNITPGWTALLPWIAKADNGSSPSQTGIGDLTLGGFLQFDPIMGENGPKFSQRVELDITGPTGQYDKDKIVNPGSHAWSVEPYYAFTYWVTPKWTTSARFMYLWNSKNNDPNFSTGASSSIQAGQAFHMNFATAYAVSKTVSIGINGYMLKQVTNTKIDGRSVSGRKEKVWAIGPGALFSIGKDDSITANVYFEQDAHNRAEGNRYILRYAHYF
ncbi:hypothetical protein MSP8887_03481 [Marinomonas spartinae]|uniref:Phenol degradation protein meta n=1 Tax=Marinomonas spartinae TaxID=1792290 RepID=A0A1A8TT61_9GAMM|nr:transporter [Marinomonas spartinae]SBS37580.1 hypothetical protein MSP8886_04184 [Marinomonas spartinae]SBS38769.1 hypothetical protein MSP8887_03481 [Marinomonas spartinae]